MKMTNINCTNCTNKKSNINGFYIKTESKHRLKTTRKRHKKPIQTTITL